MTPLSESPTRVTAYALAVIALASGTHGQTKPDCARGAPLNEMEIQQLVEVGVEDMTIRRNIAACGVTFILSDEAARRFKSLGASDALLALVAPPLNPTIGTTWTAPIDGLPMSWAPAGTFTMGSPASESGRDEDEPAHAVQIARGFWLDVHEVTNGAYRRFVLASPTWQKDRADRALHDGNYLQDWTGTDPSSGRTNHPVAWVNWAAARAYCGWAGKRLPTEAEWEYAARAGTTSAYWWGEAFASSRVTGNVATFGIDATGTSPWGFAGLAGGLWEWTASAYQPYPYRRDGRDDPQSGGDRVVRGGFYSSGARFLRVANRSYEPPQKTSDVLGFRCAF